MYYGIVKMSSIEIDGNQVNCLRFFRYDSLEEAFSENTDVMEYYQCDINHTCVLVNRVISNDVQI